MLSAAATLPMAACLDSLAGEPSANAGNRLVLTRFDADDAYVLEGAGWRGFSDRVMGGISNAQLSQDTVAGRECLRLTGNVTRESNGGFIQMALYFGRYDAELDASAYRGIELLVHGNDEDYNLHVRTADCGWHDQSYRASFFAPARWQRLRIPFADMKGNRLQVPLDTSSLQRIAILGWMREFQADVALAEIALYS